MTALGEAKADKLPETIRRGFKKALSALRSSREERAKLVKELDDARRANTDGIDDDLELELEVRSPFSTTGSPARITCAIVVAADCTLDQD